MNIFSGDDNVVADLFIKRDGSVWYASAPVPSSTKKGDCFGYKNGNIGQLTAGSAPAIQVAWMGRSILMLDADHKLWSTNEWRPTLQKVIINLK